MPGRPLTPWADASLLDSNGGTLGSPSPNAKKPSHKEAGTLKKSDRELGMGSDISRRDFIHDAGLTALGLSLPISGVAAAGSGTSDADYPPTRTGLRGSHPGAFEVAHTLRDGGAFPAGRKLNEDYDLVVVGAGISGLAAAHYYRKRFGKDARILLLENHDDFGGHAKRNEFHQSGQMRLSMGGTHNLEHWLFSDTVKSLMAELGVDVNELQRKREFAYGRNGEKGPALWFDEQTYGENKLITNCSLGDGANQDMDALIDEFPLGEVARSQLKHFYAMRTNVLKGKSDEQAQAYLKSISYPDFLRQHAGLGEEALQLFDSMELGGWGVDARALSASEGLSAGMPGLHLLGNDSPGKESDYPVAMFPDGNASLARLQVHSLIPNVAPGTNAGNVALAKFDYSALDRPDAAVRLRLNSTVINASNTGSGVTVSYINQGQSYQITSRHCVMACYHVVIPHLCPDLPKEQKTALKYQVKRPLLLTSVLVKSSKAMDKLGITGARCPGRMHDDVYLFKGINTAGYRHDFADDGPVPLVFWGAISPPKDVVHVKDQYRASRTKMLALRFEDYEREVRTVLDGMLGPAGFDVKRDVLAITVNRWPHGYSHDYLDLWNPHWPEGEAPHQIASRPYANITMANSDAGANAYTHVAIDEAFRAVNELP
ncbi:MAG: NAD(P)-binding protein [Halieaceae bacterium]|jgi:spermidine dehydrogenase|nr:NAD(P)-binding protein [Halieaceae bacterium]